jgi:anti-sigma-K factor RskA
MIEERNEESASRYVLDLLDPAERATFETELARNPELRQLVDRLRESSALLAMTPPALTPPPALRARIEASIDASAKPAGAMASAAPATSGKVASIRLPAWLGWVAAAGLALTTGYFAQQTLATRAELSGLRIAESLGRVEVQSVQNLLEAERIIGARQTHDFKVAQQEMTRLRTILAADRAAAETRMAELQKQASLAALKIASLTSPAGDTPEARAIVVWNPTTQEGVLTVAQMPALASDKDYQLWVIEEQHPTEPVNGGVFAVDPATGQARLQFRPNQPVARAAAFAVSLERKGGVPVREGPIVLLGK